MGVRRITDLEGGHRASRVSDLESVGLRAAGTPRFQINKVLLRGKSRLLLVFMALFQCLWVWKGTTGGSERDCRLGRGPYCVKCCWRFGVSRSGCWNAKISDEQSVTAGEVEASVGVHGAIPMPMGMERNIRCE